MLNAPKPGSLPTPPGCSPEEATELAIAKAKAAELTLGRWHTMITDAGVHECKIVVAQNGITIVLRGAVDGRHVSVDRLCPKGHPFPLYAVLALQEFKAGCEVFEQRWESLGPRKTEDIVRDVTPIPPPPSQAEGPTVDELEREIQVLKERHEAVLEDVAAKLAAATTRDEAFATLVETSDEIVAEAEADVPIIAADVAAEIAAKAQAWVKHGDILKPPPAGAGQRKPLSLPLCQQCKAQPVYRSGAEFCGAACAKRHFENNARVSQGRKPR